MISYHWSIHRFRIIKFARGQQKKVSKSFKIVLARAVGVGKEKTGRSIAKRIPSPCPQGNLIILCTGIMQVFQRLFSE